MDGSRNRLLRFDGTDYTASQTLNLTWYDGSGVLPPRDQLGDIPAAYQLPASGSVLIGEKGTLVIPHVAMPKVFPEAKFAAADLPIIEEVDHYTQWADACRGVGETTSHFDYAAPLTETVLLGTIGIRFPAQELAWDSSSLKITNNEKAQTFVTKPYRKGWEPTWQVD